MADRLLRDYNRTHDKYLPITFRNRVTLFYSRDLVLTRVSKITIVYNTIGSSVRRQLEWRIKIRSWRIVVVVRNGRSSIR